MAREILRGDIFFADLSPVTGSEQGGVRPVLIIQNDAGNTFAPTTIVAAITAKKTKKALPTHVSICKEAAVVCSDSVILCEQMRTIDKC
ncbi:MAG: type II toxin-antitoxin system PemK/MazF family toxin, partial [Lactococcus raffinolactis]|nr:type II toxin-antitoxin system PemK/MazF family toxin [Lactococcus raffinolactis]